MISRTIGTLLGKGIAHAVRLRGRSSGQALPGLIVENLVPKYLSSMLGQLHEGVVVITGTNGKTTTTKMVVSMLRDQGKRVLTNATGSNLTRGIISSVSQQATVLGRLPFEIAVFELDEAYASNFTTDVSPSFVLALNASRDQLDRFGEVDMVARLVGDTMMTATKAMIVNADDKRLSKIAMESDSPAVYFGVSPKLIKFFPRDDELVSVSGKVAQSQAIFVPLSVELLDFKDSDAMYLIGKNRLQASLQVTGQHNFQNAAGALALVRAVMPEVPDVRWIQSLSQVRPAFGRGQIYRLKDGTNLQLNLVKNPASFRQSLISYVRKDTRIMIAINDGIADGRDMSWLWDVDFSSLTGQTVAYVSGGRAVDMALRLKYDDIPVTTVQPLLNQALTLFTQTPGEKVVFASYTAMLKLHATLEKQAGKTL